MIFIGKKTQYINIFLKNSENVYNRLVVETKFKIY